MSTEGYYVLGLCCELKTQVIETQLCPHKEPRLGETTVLLMDMTVSMGSTLKGWWQM